MAQQSKLEKAIALIQGNDRKRGGLILIDFLRYNPDSELGWLWMTNVIRENALRLYCLDQALRINPDNHHALTMKARLHERQAHSLSSPAISLDSHNTVSDPLEDTSMAEIAIETVPLDVATAELLATEDDHGRNDANGVLTPALGQGLVSRTTVPVTPDQYSMSNLVSHVYRTVRYFDELIPPAPQNLKLAYLGGLLGMMLGAGIWGGLGLLTGLQLSYVVVVVGLITGIAVRIMGQGQQIRFGLIGAVMTILGCLLGWYVYLVPLVGTFSLAHVGPRFSILFDLPTLIMWLVTIVIGYWLSFRSPRSFPHEAHFQGPDGFLSTKG